MDLRDYESAKFELAEVLRAISVRLPKERGDPRSRLTELFTRLAEDRFNLVVAGRFSRGKSTLMNAILGVDRLPTGILPLTSVITSVAYSSREQVQIEFEQGSFGYEIPMSDLADYVTERGNPGNVKRIAKARIGLPVELLRRGFYFVDTPGLGSAIVQNARTTEGFLPEADALLMVSGYDAPLSDDELRIARTLARLKRRLFFVLNKQDVVSEGERGEVFGYVQRQLAEIFDGNAPHIFSVSARDALEAKLAGDRARLQASGIPALEIELTRFLIENKSEDFLRGMCERVLQFLGNLGSDADVQGLKRRLVALRSLGAPLLAGSATANEAAGLSLVVPRVEECPMCKRVGDVLFEFLCQFQYDLVSSADARKRFAATGGLCAIHLRAYASMASEHGICLALVPLLQRLTTTLRNAATQTEGENPAGPNEILRASDAACVLCRLQNDTELTAIEELSTGQDGVRALVRSHPQSLCLPHLRMTSSRASNRSWLCAMLQSEAAATERLTEDMQRYVLKRDGIRRGLETEEESRAAKTAIGFIAGHEWRGSADLI
jgi:GTP-binding protein EngB required for normal cell division